MKTRPLAAATLFAVLLSAGCNKSDPATEKKLAELEQQAADARRKQQELEKELAEQKLAAERDAIERERMRIEQDRLDMERKQGEAAAAAAEELRKREAELASREGKVELLNSQLEAKEDQLEQRGEELNEKDRELAGREALDSAERSSRQDDTPAGDYSMFYESLSPYGSWFETPDYGYVWQPVAVRNGSWRPYVLGRWACTDRGWTWMSDEPFGWATYHYGRWALCRGYGWVWVPGSEWAPSWVCWRSSGSHVGWAPLPPETLAYRGRTWDPSVEVAFGIGSLWFNFVETRNFCEPVHHHCLPYTQNDIYIRQTVNITHIHVKDNRVICGGPTYGDIARQTKRKPPFYRIEEDRAARPGRGALDMRHRVEEGRLRVARPVITSAWDENVKPRQIKGRIETFDVERKEPLKPEVRELVQKTREQNRKPQNRTEESDKPDRPTRREEQPVTGRPDPNPGKREVAGRGDPRPGTPPVDPRREETRNPVMPKADKPDGGPGRREEPETSQQDKNNRRALELQDELRRKNDKVNVLPKLAEPEKPSPLPRAEEKNDKARMEEQEQEKQRDMARQKQAEAQREAERQQRAEEARREQQRAVERQQQREAEKQQQRMEEARREQQRENERRQQREAERQQQQQMEEARRQQQREAERQQQREAERQQQRMEEARREQQRESERQQERARQQRNEEEQRSRGKNR